jgi:hypothetical protein
MPSATEKYLIPILGGINNTRLMGTERGYQGQLLAEIIKWKEHSKVLPPQTLVEQEYQKSNKHHGIRQRPDIVVHIPLEAGLSKNRRHNNFYVLALKKESTLDEAREDFEKLDEMFTNLDYREGVFVNIGGHPNQYLANYTGGYRNRIHEVSIGFQDNEVVLKHICFLPDGNISDHEYRFR